jgi:hypothetical protein
MLQVALLLSGGWLHFSSLWPLKGLPHFASCSMLTIRQL